MLRLLTLIAFMAVTLDRVTSISINITMNKKMRSVSYDVFLTVVKKNLPSPLSQRGCNFRSVIIDAPLDTTLVKLKYLKD